MTSLRCISIWQPFAALLVHTLPGGLRHKAIETRPFPAPRTVLGERIGIASTKIVTPAQRAAYADETFQGFYSQTGLPPLEELPHGFLLGTVFVYDCERMTEELIEDVTDEEKAYGIWTVGRYAWRTKEPELFPVPIPVMGKQGIWIYERPLLSLVK